MSKLGEKMRKIFTIIILNFFLMCVFSNGVFAASGAFRIFGADAEAIAKGGAFTGEADNPSAVIFNPAGLTQLKGENYVSVGTAVISPMVDYTNSSGTETQMRRENFIVPHVYAVSDFGLEKVVFGVGVGSGFGLSTEWAENSFSRYHAVKTDLENMDNHITMAYQLSDNLSLGVGAIFEVSKFSKTKNVNQQPGSDAFSQLKGDDTTPGYTISALYQVNPRHSFGLLYRSEIEHEYEGRATADGLNDSGTLPYATLFGTANYATDFVADFTIPQSGVFGYSYLPNDQWRVNFDVEWMDWSSIESEKVNFPNETNATRLAILEALTASNRDWESTITYALGTEYTYNDKLQLRGGYTYIPTPIPEATFDTTLPSGDAHAASLGFGYKIRDNLTLDMSWMGMFYADREIINTIGDSVGSNLDGTYENFINIGMATITYKFP
jgi:long-chain fatty acid transport protein